MDEVTQVVQSTLTDIAIKLAFLPLLMFGFAIIVFLLLWKVNMGKSKKIIAGLASLVGAYVWFNIFLL